MVSNGQLLKQSIRGKGPFLTNQSLIAFCFQLCFNLHNYIYFENFHMDGLVLQINQIVN
jgi:hypothetical protein